MLTAQASLLNGLVGEADSLLKAILETYDDTFTKDAMRLTSVGEKIETHYVDKLTKMGETL